MFLDHMCLEIHLPQIDLGGICKHPISQSMVQQALMSCKYTYGIVWAWLCL